MPNFFLCPPPKDSHLLIRHISILAAISNMADEEINIYDEIEIEDMTFDPNLQIYTYPCPCGDRFEIAIDDLRDGEDIGVCPSCSLMIRVIFDVVCFASYI
jgi:diphthamide biosynthesis protein 3